MPTNKTSLERPIRVVMFGSGPVLTPDARKFLSRLEDHAEIELTGAFCQAKSQSIGAMVKDLYQRRGILAAPLFFAWIINSTMPFLTNPVESMRLRRKLAQLSPKLHFVVDIHADDVLNNIAALSPDLGLIYGSPILKPELFEIPSQGTFGIHHGQLPKYRGNKTMFWAMFNNEKTAGVTIQKVNTGLDTGLIVKEGEVEIGRHTQRVVWRKLETLGLDLYIDAILEVKNGEATYSPQSSSKGKLYRNPKLGDYLRFWSRGFKRRFS